MVGGKAVPAADNPDMPRIFTEVPLLIWRPAQKDPISPAVMALTSWHSGAGLSGEKNPVLLRA
jgi:hypothetical protein